LEDGDIVMACDNDHAAIFQVTNANSSNVTIVHNTGASVSPGNCSQDLRFPTNCNNTTCGNNNDCYSFAGNGFLAKLAKLSAEAWYIGYNGRGGRSLYRLKLQNDDGKAKDTAEEVAEGVSNLQIRYLTRDAAGNLAYLDADQVDRVSDWTQVVAVRLAFTLQPLEDVATGGGALQRTWNTVVTLRNLRNQP
jgi:type IV pilus assembly protein PilW